ncbi:JmjC domain containing protein [Plasmodium gaboni]|uniref:JmjC domain containing protein n=1 Tax=Plasmodium gaboni TaxID=647221 RepID=A0ABY1UM12_9APIC|nr:JmjC domain containing protein [Plasmodium gaboni]
MDKKMNGIKQRKRNREFVLSCNDDDDVNYIDTRKNNNGYKNKADKKLINQKDLYQIKKVYDTRNKSFLKNNEINYENSEEDNCTYVENIFDEEEFEEWKNGKEKDDNDSELANELFDDPIRENINDIIGDLTNEMINDITNDISNDITNDITNEDELIDVSNNKYKKLVYKNGINDTNMNSKKCISMVSEFKGKYVLNKKLNNIQNEKNNEKNLERLPENLPLRHHARNIRNNNDNNDNNNIININNNNINIINNNNNNNYNNSNCCNNNCSYNYDDENIYKRIKEIPEINTTMEEMTNPMLFFEKYNYMGLKYGALKVIPPNFFSPQFNSYYLNIKFNIRRQMINELKNGKEFDHPDEYWTLYEMYKYNEMLQNKYLSSDNKFDLENIEKTYWDIINNKKNEDVISVYGADLPVKKNQPTCIFPNKYKSNMYMTKNNSNDILIKNEGNKKNKKYTINKNNEHKKNEEHNKNNNNNNNNNKYNSSVQNNIDEIIIDSDEDEHVKSVKTIACGQNKIKENSTKASYTISKEKVLQKDTNEIIEVINILDTDNEEDRCDNKIENDVMKSNGYNIKHYKNNTNYNIKECNNNNNNNNNNIYNDKRCGNNINNIIICKKNNNVRKDSNFLERKDNYFCEINDIISNISENMNIKSLPFVRGSMLRNIDILIEGVNIPWLYIGTLFSTFCWHTEDNYFASINYQHWGQPKIWYVIPPHYSDKVEDVIYEYLKENSKININNNTTTNNKGGASYMGGGRRRRGKYFRKRKFSMPSHSRNNRKSANVITNEKSIKSNTTNININSNNNNNNNNNFNNNNIIINNNNINNNNNYYYYNNRNNSLNLCNRNNLEDDYIYFEADKNNKYNFLNVNINDVDLIYTDPYLKYKIIDKEEINSKKENNKNKIYKLTIQIPVEVFLRNNIPVYKNIQRKNEFIFLWPKTFHGGFNSGYNCNEACNIAPTFWLFFGLQSYYNYKYYRNTCISIHFILFSNLLHFHEYNFSQLKHIIYSLKYILLDEYRFFCENQSIYIDLNLQHDVLLNKKIVNYSNFVSLDLVKIYYNFEKNKNSHFFQSVKSKLHFFYKDCDACNSPTFNSAVICPHSDDIVCIHCYDEHACNCKYRVVLKRYTLLEMMKILKLLIHYANKIKNSDEKEINFDDMPNYNSMKFFEEENSFKLFNLIRQNKKRNTPTIYADLENYCAKKLINIEKFKKTNNSQNNNIILDDYYTSVSHFKTKLTLKYFFLTYEEEKEENAMQILPKIVS